MTSISGQVFKILFLLFIDNFFFFNQSSIISNTGNFSEFSAFLFVILDCFVQCSCSSLGERIC
jgi:hypothetical protein